MSPDLPSRMGRTPLGARYRSPLGVFGSKPEEAEEEEPFIEVEDDEGPFLSWEDEFPEGWIAVIELTISQSMSGSEVLNFESLGPNWPIHNNTWPRSEIAGAISSARAQGSHEGENFYASYAAGQPKSRSLTAYVYRGTLDHNGNLKLPIPRGRHYWSQRASYEQTGQWAEGDKIRDPINRYASAFESLFVGRKPAGSSGRYTDIWEISYRLQMREAVSWSIGTRLVAGSLPSRYYGGLELASGSQGLRLLLKIGQSVSGAASVSAHAEGASMFNRLPAPDALPKNATGSRRVTNSDGPTTGNQDIDRLAPIRYRAITVYR